MNNKIKLVKQILNEMNDFRSSPRSQVDRFHHEMVHNHIHNPISQEVKALGFFINKPEHKNGVANYSVSGNYRGNEILTHQLGIGKSLIPLPQHHPTQEHSVRHLVDRAFSKKPTKYLKYLKTIHTGLTNAIEAHRQKWNDSHKAATESFRSMKQKTVNSLSNSVPIGSTIEQHQLMAHHHSETAAQHERNIRELELHRQTITRHANALGRIFGVDASEQSSGDLNSRKIVSGVWDEVL
jgi:hypothetical protein